MKSIFSIKTFLRNEIFSFLSKCFLEHPIYALAVSFWPTCGMLVRQTFNLQCPGFVRSVLSEKTAVFWGVLDLVHLTPGNKHSCLGISSGIKRCLGIVPVTRVSPGLGGSGILCKLYKTGAIFLQYDLPPPHGASAPPSYVFFLLSLLHYFQTVLLHPRRSPFL